MRAPIALSFICALALFGCGQPAGQAGGGAGGSGAAAAGANTPDPAAPAWVRAQWSSLQDWDYPANLSDGGKAGYSPRSIRRDPSDGSAEVTVEILHRDPLPYEVEGKTTIERNWYFKEHAVYHFNCPGRMYYILSRSFLGAADVEIGSEHADPAHPDWKPIDASGFARVLEGPVCKAA